MRWDPRRGYRDVQTGEWVASPVEAVSGYIEADPEAHRSYETLARRVEGFWLGTRVEDIGDLRQIEEVRFEC